MGSRCEAANPIPAKRKSFSTASARRDVPLPRLHPSLCEGCVQRERRLTQRMRRNYFVAFAFAAFCFFARPTNEWNLRCFAAMALAL